MSSHTQTKNAVLKALGTINDPELYLPITDLGLVYDVTIKNSAAHITITLTTVGCPLYEVIESEITKKVGAVVGIKNVHVKLTFDPPWSPEKMTEKAKAELGIGS